MSGRLSREKEICKFHPKPQHLLEERLLKLKKNQNLAFSSVEKDEKILDESMKEINNLQAKIENHELHFVSEELKQRFKDSDVSLKEQQIIVKKEIELAQKALEKSRREDNPEYSKTIISYLVMWTGVRFIRPEDPKNIECVVLNRKQKDFQNICVEKEPKTEVVETIFNAMKSIQS